MLVGLCREQMRLISFEVAHETKPPPRRCWGDRVSSTAAKMSTQFPDSPATASWQDEIRKREEEARVAFLTADLAALEGLWADGFAVNSPLQKVLEKKSLMEALRAGRIRHQSYECEIEYMNRAGDVVVVMGRDRVVDPPNGVVSQRRYTNVWRLEGGMWRSIARHAHVVSRDAAPVDAG